jgi:uncharacterized coiled-coil protein SlyX
LTMARSHRIFPSMRDYEVVAQELSLLGERMREFEMRLAEVERVNARLEDAALTTARALSEIARHWDAVYEAMRRTETTELRPSPIATTMLLGGAARRSRRSAKRQSASAMRESPAGRALGECGCGLSLMR